MMEGKFAVGFCVEGYETISKTETPYSPSNNQSRRGRAFHEEEVLCQRPTVK